MSAEALVEPLTGSPLRALLRHRFSSRVDRALVFLSAEEEDRVAHPRGPDACDRPRPSLRMVRRKSFQHACWVSLVEHTATVEIRGTAAGAGSRRSVIWWVDDPALAARSRLRAEEVPGWIAQALNEPGSAAHRALPGWAAGPDPLEDSEYRVGPIGIGFRVRFRAPSSLPDPVAGPMTPPAWGEDQRAAYHFYRQVVAGGPQALAALWLLHHPDEAHEVLEWTARNTSLLTEDTSWERTLVGLIQDLDTDDSHLLGVTVAQVLAGLGVPRADETLARLRKAEAARGAGVGSRW